MRRLASARDWFSVRQVCGSDSTVACLDALRQHAVELSGGGTGTHMRFTPSEDTVNAYGAVASAIVSECEAMGDVAERLCGVYAVAAALREAVDSSDEAALCASVESWARLGLSPAALQLLPVPDRRQSPSLSPSADHIHGLVTAAHACLRRVRDVLGRVRAALGSLHADSLRAAVTDARRAGVSSAMLVAADRVLCDLSLLPVSVADALERRDATAASVVLKSAEALCERAAALCDGDPLGAPTVAACLPAPTLRALTELAAVPCVEAEEPTLPPPRQPSWSLPPSASFPTWQVSPRFGPPRVPSAALPSPSSTPLSTPVAHGDVSASVVCGRAADDHTRWHGQSVEASLRGYTGMRPAKVRGPVLRRGAAAPTRSLCRRRSLLLRQHRRVTCPRPQRGA